VARELLGIGMEELEEKCNACGTEIEEPGWCESCERLRKEFIISSPDPQAFGPGFSDGHRAHGDRTKQRGT